MPSSVDAPATPPALGPAPNPGVVAPVVTAFVLSIAGFGLLAIAMSWPVQAGMAVPFALAAYVLGRRSGQALRVGIAMLCGAAPLGLLLAQFRNAEGSHLMPVLVVLSWAGGIGLGAALAARGGGEAQAGW